MSEDQIRPKVAHAVRERVFPESSGDTSPPRIREGDGTTAIIVCHGMGQQVPFETLDRVGSILCRGIDEERAKVISHTARHVVLGEESLPRVELTIEKPGVTQKRTVHLYEVYWAPLTEGQVTLRDTAAFLWNAGLGGLSKFVSGQPFDRWMFGKSRDLSDQGLKSSKLAEHFFCLGMLTAGSAGVFLLSLLWVLAFGGDPEIQQLLAHGLVKLLAAWALLTLLMVLTANTTTRSLFFALVVFGALVAIDSLIAGAAVSSALKNGAKWDGDLRLGVLTCDLFALVLAMSVLALVGIGGARGLRRFCRYWFRSAEIPLGLGRLFRLCVFAALGCLCVAGLLVFWHSIDPKAGKQLWKGTPVWRSVYRSSSKDTQQLQVELAGVLWVLLGFASRKMRDLLVQFPGDVAVYVNSHQVDRFYELRRRIKETGRKVFSGVYDARDGDSEFFRYERVIVVGHSLGSVVAYDALNGLFALDDTLNGRLQAVERTKLFLTFGSPLDKTAFLFRSQAPKGSANREALASAMQPLIVDEKYRRKGVWVNLYSPDDWISGPLDFYDKRGWADKKDPRRVENVLDPEACTPGLAHNEYWENTLLRKILCDEVLEQRKGRSWHSGSTGAEEHSDG